MPHPTGIRTWSSPNWSPSSSTPFRWSCCLNTLVSGTVAFSRPCVLTIITCRGRPLLCAVIPLRIQGGIHRGNQLDAVVRAQGVTAQVCPCSVCQGGAVLVECRGGV